MYRFQTVTRSLSIGIIGTFVIAPQFFGIINCKAHYAHYEVKFITNQSYSSVAVSTAYLVSVLVYYLPSRLISLSLFISFYLYVYIY